jgi:hypothetical protein
LRWCRRREERGVIRVSADLLHGWGHLMLRICFPWLAHGA